MRLINYKVSIETLKKRTTNPTSTSLLKLFINNNQNSQNTHLLINHSLKTKNLQAFSKNHQSMAR